MDSEKQMTVRSFFAIELQSKPIIKKIEEFQGTLSEAGGKIKLVEPQNLHLTLKFLGDINESLIPTLQAELEKISMEKFVIEYKGIGCLPGFHRINSIFVDITEGQQQLVTLAQKIEQVCEIFNLRKENRPYKAHLTIARVKYPGDKQALIDIIKSKKNDVYGKVDATEFKLKKSELTPKGPIYSDLFNIELQ